MVPETRETLLGQFCTQLMALRQFDEIVRVLTSPLAGAGGLTASLHFTLGLAYLELKQSREAADQMRQCLAKRDQPSLSPINQDIRKAGPRHCLALCLDQLGETAAAAEEFRRAVQDDPQSRPARFDFARFLAAHGQPVEALNLLFALTNERADELPVWLLGGQIALGKPEFLEVALDWTAEALPHAGEDAGVRRQRAEALMLSGQCESALPLWRQLPANPESTAAAVLCGIVAGEDELPVPDHLEAQVSREFLKWYQRLLQFNARSTVEGLNGRIESWQRALPSAGRILGAAMAEAREEAVA